MASTTLKPHQKELFGHPIGLYVLFFTEMWERFSYYGMRALLTTYMTAMTLENDPQSGLGWTSSEALSLYGWYTMLVYVSSIPGGMIADRFLGQKKTVLIGGVLLVIGHSVLAIDAIWAYYTGLGFIICGVGMLKPNISSMVGGLYKKNDIRRDKGFSIFYVGINLGSFFSSIAVGLVVVKYGWHAGFGLAGIGMLIGLLVYLYGHKYLITVGNKPTIDDRKTDISVFSLFSQLLNSPKQLIIVVLLLIYSLYAGFTYEGSDHWGYGVLFIFISLVTGMMMMIYKNLESKVDKDRYVVLLLSFMLVIVFWGAFEQVGGLMNLYTESKTDRMLFGWEVPTAFFQGINAGFIILFAVTIANIWAKRKLKNKEASSLFKMATGIIIMGLGFFFMVGASSEYQSSGASGMYWLVLAYLFHTIGELCLSPVSLSFVTKLAPVKYAALMMGVYWAATGLGNKVAGVVGETSQLEPFKGVVVASKQEIFKFVEKDSIEVKNAEKDIKIYDYPINEDRSFSLKANVYLENKEVVFKDAKTDASLNSLFIMSKDEDSNTKELLNTLKENNITLNNPYHAKLVFEKDKDKAQIVENKGDGKDYGVSFVLEEQQNDQEYKIFMLITVFTVAFGLLLILFLKKLKKLTHGAEDNEKRINNETEGFELADS